MGRKLRNLQRWFRRRGRRGGATLPIAAKSAAKDQPRGITGWLYESPSDAVKKKGKRSGGGIPRRYVFFTMLFLLVALSAYSFYRFDRRILPMVLEAAELRIQTEINAVINEVIHDIVAENQITAADFIMKTQLSPDTNPILSVNTILVNEISNTAAQSISEQLNNLEPEVVYVPLGMALGLDTLAQVGPEFSFKLAPIGNALVNYESSFTAVGINQTHFSVWLTVESVVRIINPVQSTEVEVIRHVSLVDTIISGTVPDTYLNMDMPALGFGDTGGTAAFHR